MTKTIIIGIDGACWEYMEPLLEEGRLPNVKKMMDMGSYGILESVLPPVSPVAWSSIITGTNAGKHGIFSWTSMDRKGSHEPVNSTMRKVSPFWKYLNKEGLKIGVFNIPVNYPAEEINGYIIPGFDAPANHKDSVYPKDLYGVIKEKYGDFLNKLPLDLLCNPKALMEMGIEVYFQKYCFSEEMRTNLALDLTKECDVVLFNYMITDHLNHQIREFEFVKKAYCFVDRMIGKWLKMFPKENYILMSDHGSTRIKGIVNLNHLFFNKGLLQFKKQQIESLTKEKVNEILYHIHCKQGWNKSIFEKIFRRIKLFFLYSNIKKYRVNRLKKLYETESEVFDSFLHLNQIDYRKTLLHVNTDNGFIFLNKKYLEQQERNNKKYYKQVMKELMSFKDPFTNNPFFSFICKTEDLYKGNQINSAPELYGHFWESTCFISTSIDFNPSKSVVPYFQVGKDEIGTYGSHQKNGIYITNGANIKNAKRKSSKKYSLLDVMPTVFYLHNVAIPDYFDGQVMTDIISSEYINSNAVKFGKSIEHISKEKPSEISVEEKSQIIERLKLLGYID